jgi:hypothetical protein
VKLKLQARGALIQRHDVTVYPFAGLAEPELADRMSVRLCADHLPVLLARLASMGFTIVEPAAPALEEACK